MRKNKEPKNRSTQCAQMIVDKCAEAPYWRKDSFQQMKLDIQRQNEQKQ